MEKGSDQALELPVLSQVGRDPEMARAWPDWLRWCIVGLLVAIASTAIYYGLQLREYAFVSTTGYHFNGDVNNGFEWGQRGKATGLFQIYDARGVAGSNLDYTPLRLAVVTAWVAWEQRIDPNIRGWSDSYEITSPMLHLNTLAELVSSVFVFLLIRMWVIRMDDANRPIDSSPRPFRGVIQGMIGAAFLWFNPAVIWDGHCWPQWDVWVVPFFVAALWLACVDWWFAAGACIVVGAFLKGQMLLGAPVLILWPLFSFRFGAVLRLISGLTFTTAVVVFPWMRPERPEMTWYFSMLVGLALTIPLVFNWRIHWSLLLGSGIAAAIFVWPWQAIGSPQMHFLPLLIVAGVSLARILPRRVVPHVYALAIGLTILLMMPLYGASSSWYAIGFEHGSMKYDGMLTGGGTFNLAALLSRSWRTVVDPNELLHLPFTGRLVTYRVLMGLIYAICVALCAIGAAIHDRRKDVRFLVAMAAPWTIFYVLMVQMHGRYLLWGAAMSALLIGVSFGMGFIAIIISIIAFLGMFLNQYTIYRYWDSTTVRTIQQVHPHLGWMLLLACAVLLYMAILPRSRVT